MRRSDPICASSELLPQEVLHRVPGALSAAVDGLVTVTTCTEPDYFPTDIPEDFSVMHPVAVTVPANALFLFAGINGCPYGDNSDPDGDLEIAIRILPE